MVSIDIERCVWVPSSQTLIVSKQDLKISLGGNIPLIIGIVGKIATIQFFWDAERRIYKFDKVLEVKNPTKYYANAPPTEILIVVV